MLSSIVIKEDLRKMNKKSMRKVRFTLKRSTKKRKQDRDRSVRSFELIDRMAISHTLRRGAITIKDDQALKYSRCFGELDFFRSTSPVSSF